MPKPVLAWAALLMLAAASVPAQAGEDAVRIGVLTDMSGPVRDMSGPGAVAAVELAIEDFGPAVLGRPIKVVSADHQLRPDSGSAIARRWYDQDGVDMIVDVPVSAIGLAVQQIAREKRKLFITTATITSDFTGKFCSRYSMQWLFDTTALSNSTVSALMDQGLKRWFFLTQDTAFGHSLEADARRLIQAKGGSVIGSVEHPFAAPDMTSFILQAQSSGAEAIGLLSGPPDSINAMKAAAEFGLARDGKQRLAGAFVLLTDIKGIGLEAAQGLLLTEGFYWDRDEETRAWSQRFYKKMGKMPTAVQAADYSAALHYLRGVQAAGTLDADKVAAAMRERPVQDFYAQHATLRPSGLLVHDLYLLRVKAPSASKQPWDLYDVVQTVDGNTVFPSPEAEGCRPSQD